MRRLGSLLAVIVAATLASVLLTACPAPGQYVTRNGTRLSLAGNNFRAVGYNIPWIAPSCGGASQSWLDESFPKFANHSGARVFRFTAAQVYRNGALDWSAVDRYVVAAGKYGVRLVPNFVDNWGQCGDGGSERYLPYWQTGYASNTSSSQPLTYKAYVQAFANRYKNETAIAWYQLANEPDARSSGGGCDETSAKNALRSFADTMTDAIKAIDTNHLVDLGAISWCGGQGADFGYVTAGKVDLCDVHHDYDGGSVAFPSSEASEINQCTNVNGKPSFVGEAGIQPGTTASSLQTRANQFGAKMDATFSHGGIGYIIWVAVHGCSTNNGDYAVGANNGTASYSCAVPEVDPVEAVMAAHA